MHFNALSMSRNAYAALLGGAYAVNAQGLRSERYRASQFSNGGDPYRIRTDVNGVRGRCLNHLTNGPFGAPSRTRTGDPLIKSQLLYQLS